MSGPHFAASRVEVGHRRFATGLMHQWRRILLCALTITGLAFLLAGLSTPIFRGEARLLIETPGSALAPSGTPNRQTHGVSGEQGIASQLEVVSSSDILKQVATNLDLSKRAEFNQASGSSLDRFLTSAGLKAEIPAEERILQRMRDRLRIYTIEKSSLIAIEFSSEDARLSADIPNAVAEAYVAVRRAGNLASGAQSAQNGAPASIDSRPYLPEARIVSRAAVPSQPSVPKIFPIVGATFAGSLAVAAIVTLFGAFVSGRAARAGHPTPVEPPPLMSEGDTYSTALPSAEDEHAAANLKRGAGEVDIDHAVEQLISTGIERAIFISPEGDEASSSSVLTARDIADAGLRVLLLDLTATGAASSTMLEGSHHKGITNLLCREAQFGDVIHADHYSECHVIPVGTGDPAQAMQAADRLPLIVDSLASVYDLIVIECGPAQVPAIDSLAAEATTIVISVLESDDADVTRCAAELRNAGYDELMFVTPTDRLAAVPEELGRDAA